MRWNLPESAFYDSSFKSILLRNRALVFTNGNGASYIVTLGAVFLKQIVFKASPGARFGVQAVWTGGFQTQLVAQVAAKQHLGQNTGIGGGQPPKNGPTAASFRLRTSRGVR